MFPCVAPSIYAALRKTSPKRHLPRWWTGKRHRNIQRIPAHIGQYSSDLGLFVGFPKPGPRVGDGAVGSTCSKAITFLENIETTGLVFPFTESFQYAI